jgi:hypothetical protein
MVRTDYRGRHFHRNDPVPNLRGCDLRDAVFLHTRMRGVSMRCADLSFARIVQCDFTGADLTGACLFGVEVKKGSTFRGATLNDCMLPDGRCYEDYIDQLPGMLDLLSARVPQLARAYREGWVRHDSPDGSRNECSCRQIDPIEVAALPEIVRHHVRQFVWLFDDGLLPRGGRP